MSEHQSFAELCEVLAHLYPSEGDARRIAKDAGLDTGKITFSGNAINSWSAILLQTQNERKTAYNWPQKLDHMLR